MFDILKAREMISRGFETIMVECFLRGKRNARAQLQGAIQLISKYPNVGHPLDDFNGALEYPIRKTPLTMIHRIKGNEPQVLRILDQRGGFFNERSKHP